jgi:hypothetical protein
MLRFRFILPPADAFYARRCAHDASYAAARDTRERALAAPPEAAMFIERERERRFDAAAVCCHAFRHRRRQASPPLIDTLLSPSFSIASFHFFHAFDSFFIAADISPTLVSSPASFSSILLRDAIATPIFTCHHWLCILLRHAMPFSIVTFD